MDVSPLLWPVLLTGLLLAASLFDATRFRIPNAIPALVVAAFVLKASAGMAAGPLLPHVLVFLAALLLGFIAFAAGIFGGGDAKLMAALALWFGPAGFADFIAITGIAGGIFALLLLLIRRPWGSVAIAQEAGASFGPHRLLDPKAPVPYALPMTFAALWLAWF